MGTAVRQSTRTITVRVPSEVNADLGILSRVTGTSVSEHVRAAVSLYIFTRMHSDTLDADIAAAKERFATDIHKTLEGHAAGSRSRGDTGKKPDGHPLSIRLTNIQESRLKGLALLDDNSIAEQLRQALDQYLEQERNEEMFVQCRESLDRLRQDLTKVFLEEKTPELPTRQDGRLPIYSGGGYALDAD